MEINKKTLENIESAKTLCGFIEFAMRISYFTLNNNVFGSR